MTSLRKLFAFEDRQARYAVMIMLTIAGLTGLFLLVYFRSYQIPFMAQTAINISDDWHYQLTPTAPIKPLKDLAYSIEVPANQPLRLYKQLSGQVENAALLIKTNHQTVRLYLDQQQLFASGSHEPGQNPGMGLFFVPLPADYANKQLVMEIISPYSHYSGRTSPVLLGDIQSLQAYTLSQSMRSVILMSICLFLGFCTISLTIVQALRRQINWGNFSLGLFAVVWGLYYPCTDYIAYQFFSPGWMSVLSIGFYFSMQVPLSLFFYFSARHYQKQFLFAVLIHCGFVVTAFWLQALSLRQFPELLNINNFIYIVVFLYSIILSVLEIKKGNRFFLLITPFMAIAYSSLMMAFTVFYGTRGPVNYNIYKDTFLLLILTVLAYNIMVFFRQFYQRQQEVALLTLKNRLAFENYAQIELHLSQVAGLKHELNHHFAALQILFTDGKYEQCRDYLAAVTQQSNQLAAAAYCEHFLINAVVSNFLNTASAKNIAVEYQISVPPQLHIADPDLYSLLTNILENALESNANIPEVSKRYIKLYIHTKAPYLFISCENAKNHPVLVKDDKILTTKTDTANHGYGLWTIKKISQKYDGMVDIDYHADDFKIMTALKEKPANAG
ncbi:MAG: GHKL domain-containing protein [Sporomusaceae bacterium]|nr:GHKL domain-containing protein [Sporomusaceae bacterium]